jgi:4-amino-4-deoxy-L-arabinose transferase-like glycosyltransferase
MKGNRRYPGILLATCLCLFAYGLGNRDFWDPDEPRYAGIARSIVESGDWLALRDNGRPYADKPPLYFWFLAVASRLGPGVTPATSRVPSSLFALLTVLLTYRFGKDLFGARVGFLGGLVLATTQRFFVEARWVHIDMLLCLLVLVALVSAYRALETKKRWWWLVGYSAMAAGCMAKGPVALTIPLIALLTYLATSRQLDRMRETWWPVGIPAAVLPALAWLWTFSGRTGLDPVEVLRTQVFERFREGIHHPRPSYYYLISLPLEFLPWTPFLAGAVAVSFPLPGRGDRKPLLFLYGWILGGVSFLSVSAEKRPSYLLPLLPPLALLVAYLWDRYLVSWNAGSLRPWVEGPLLVYAGACLVAIAFIGREASRYPGIERRLIPLALVYLATCAVTLYATWNSRRGSALLGLLGGLIVGYFWIAGSVLPWLNGYKSARPFCEAIVSRIGRAPLAIYGDYHAAFAYYTHRRLEILRAPGDLELFLSPPGGGFCIVEMSHFRRLEAQLPLQELAREAVGHRTYLLVSSMPNSIIPYPPPRQ